MGSNTGEVIMDDERLAEIAYAMQEAYRQSKNREDACLLVLNKHPDSPTEIHHAMWHAIDAYVDREVIGD